MKMSKLGKALFAALSAASPVLAADSALPDLVGDANRKTFNKKDIKAKLIALDATLNPQQLDNVIDALLDVEQDPNPVETPSAMGVDESPADKVRAMLAGKVDDALIDQICTLIAAPSADEKQEPEGEGVMKKEEVAAAMDSLRKELSEASEAAREVRSVVGDVAMDSAAEIYGFALDHMSIDRKGVEGVPALRALFKVAASGKTVTATAPSVALDSAAALKQFPGLSRFKGA